PALGAKLDHNDYTGYEAEPSGRLQWNLDTTQLLWAAVSRAVRTPSRYDHDLVVPSGLVEAPLTQQLPGSLSIFYNDYSTLRSTTATAATPTYPYPYPVYFRNNLEGDTYGAELSASYQLLDWWRLHLGYDLL